MAPFDIKVPEIKIREIPVVGRGISLPKISDLTVSLGPKMTRPQDVAPDLRLKNRNPKEYWEGQDIIHNGKPYQVKSIVKDGKKELILVPNETGLGAMNIVPSLNLHVMSLSQKPQEVTETKPIQVTPAEIEDAKTDVFLLGGVYTAEAIFEMFGVDFSPAVKQRRAFLELQLGLRPGDLENSPLGLPELAERRAQIKRLTWDAKTIVKKVYAGKEVNAPKEMSQAAYLDIKDWAQRGKELGMPQDMVIEVAVTHISRKSEAASPTQDHKNTVLDITEAVDLARSKERGKRELSPAEKENEVAEKRAAFLASMDPKVAKFYMDATDEKGKPLFSSQEVSLYEQYSVLRIFLENGGTPDPKTLQKNREEREAFLAVVLPSIVPNETEAQKILSNAILEFLTNYSDMSDKEARIIIRNEFDAVQKLAREGAGMIPDSQVRLVEDNEIELSESDLFIEEALSVVVGPVLAEEIVDTGVYLRDTDPPTSEFQIGALTDPDQANTGLWSREKNEFLDDLKTTQRWQGPQVIELDTADLMDVRPAPSGDLVDRKGQQYSISKPRIWTDAVKLEPGQVVARIEGSANGGVWKDFNDGRGKRRAVKVTFSIEEPQKIRNGQTHMVDGYLIVWMTPEKAQEMEIIPINHNNYWVLSEVN